MPGPNYGCQQKDNGEDKRETRWLLVLFSDLEYVYLSITLLKYAKMGLRAAKIAPYSSASRSKQLLCCFFAYLAKIDPIDFLKPLWLCGLYIVQTAAIFGSQTHTLHLLIFTSSWWQSFFFSRSWLSSRQLMLLDLEWNCDKQFSFRSTKIWLRVRLEKKSMTTCRTWRRGESFF